MTEEQTKALDEALLALSFYANRAIYWGDPIDLYLNLDERTLKIKHDSIQASQIMQDEGEMARDALLEFERVFEVEYEVQTEP